MASSHIDALDGTDTGANFIGSVAIIPWLRGSFRVFIVGLKHSGKLHRWTTYMRARDRQLEIDDTHVRWSIEGRDGLPELEAEGVCGGLLHAPLRKAMHQRVEDTLDARITVRHLDASGHTLLEGTAHAAGLEVFGDTDRLLGL